MKNCVEAAVHTNSMLTGTPVKKKSPMSIIFRAPKQVNI